LRAADAGEAHIYIPAVVIAECLMVAEKGRIPGLAVEGLLEHFEAIRGSENFLPTVLSPDLILASHRLTMIPDIFDRLIVTEAEQRGLPLLTRDSVIRESGLVETIWD
jgi:PIN domain nuclease of toxin-antitoxin system